MAGLLIWQASMVCLTSNAAEYEANQYERLYKWYADHRVELELYNYEFRVSQYDTEENNLEEHLFWSAVCLGNLSYGFGGFEGDDYFLPYGEWRKPWETDEVYLALTVYDTEENCIEHSGKDFFCFEYLTKEQWDKEESESGLYARAMFDKEKLTEFGQELMENENVWPYRDY